MQPTSEISQTALSQILAEMGLSRLEHPVDHCLTKAFRKEDQFPMIERFWVVQEAADQPYLLKSMPSWKLDGSRLPPSLAEARQIVRALQQEVFSAKIAALVDYPVPATDLVVYRGTRGDVPCLSYQYFEHAREFSSQIPFLNYAKLGMEVANIEAVQTRALFNLLLGNDGDNFQAILVPLRPTQGFYYAQDLAAGVSPYIENPSDPELPKQLAQSIVPSFGATPQSFPWGHLPSPFGVITYYVDRRFEEFLCIWDDTTADSLRSFAAKAARITREQAQAVFECGVYSPREREFLAQQLLNRAAILPDVSEEALRMG